MTPADVKALIDHWQCEAIITPTGEPYDAGYAAALRVCASELDAILQGAGHYDNTATAEQDVKQESSRAGGAQATSDEDAPVSKAECLDCGLPYSDFPLDVILPRSQWLEIHSDENGLLCAACMVKRVKARVRGATVIHMFVEVAPWR